MFVGLGAVLLLVLFYATWKLFFSSKVKVPVSPGAKFLSGHIHQLKEVSATTKYKYDEVFLRLTDPKSVGSAVGHLKFWTNSQITLGSAKTAEIVLKSRTNLNKGALYDDLRRWLQDSVLVLPSQAWSTRRKQLTPAFHFAIMEDFESTMKEHSHLLIDAIRTNPNRPVLNHLLDVAIHTIVQTSFGTSFTSLEDSAPYRNGIRKIMDCLWSKDWSSMLEMSSQWYYYNVSSNGKREIEAIEELNALLLDLLKERKKEYALGETRLHNGRKSFLDHVVEVQATEGGLTDEQIVGESNTVLVAGHETTSASVAWTLYFLCKHPDVQDRVYNEIVEHLAGKPFDTLEVGSLAYLNMVVKESMRIQPPFSSIGRVLTESITVDGWTFPPGTEVEIVIYWIHRDPEFWPDPEKFDPERFSAENSRGRNPYAFVPFSAGPRNCIGQRFATLESRILIAAIIKNFKISTTQELGVDLRRDVVDLTSIPGPDFRIQFHPRD